jgi:hypothetical protein
MVGSTNMWIALSRRIHPRVAFTIFVSLGMAWGGVAPCPPAVGAERVLALYAPAKDDFRREYHRDLANGKLQTWDQYWAWVQTFYAGNLLSDGWTKRGDQSLAAIKSRKNLQDLVERYNALGKIVSREWAKDYAVRKISTADLRRWHQAMADAVRTDNGSGERIKQALDSIRVQVEKQLVSCPRASEPAAVSRVFDAVR